MNAVISETIHARKHFRFSSLAVVFCYRSVYNSFVSIKGSLKMCVLKGRICLELFFVFLFICNESQGRVTSIKNHSAWDRHICSGGPRSRALSKT